MYLLAMAPHAFVVLRLIEVVCGEHRAMARQYCLYLVPATFWRWICLSHSTSDAGRPACNSAITVVAALPQILLLRLLSNVATTWGSVLAGVPAFFGLFLGGFAVPLLLESRQPMWSRVRQALSWIRFSAGGLRGFYSR